MLSNDCCPISCPQRSFVERFDRLRRLDAFFLEGGEGKLSARFALRNDSKCLRRAPAFAFSVPPGPYSTDSSVMYRGLDDECRVRGVVDVGESNMSCLSDGTLFFLAQVVW